MRAPAPRRSDAGNVMFFILIAIMLLAALSFAITQGGRDSGNNLSTERQRLLATEIIDYGDVLQKSVQILRSRGVAFTALSFAAPGLPAAYGAPGAAPTAEIFNDAGAAALYKRADDQSFASAAQDYIFTARNEIADVGTTCGGDDCADLLALLPGLARAVCIEINHQLAIGTDGAEPPLVTTFDMTPFAGTATYAQTISNAAINGKTAACVGNSTGGSTVGYVFYQVLLPR